MIERRISELKDWLDEQRSYAHTVYPRHIQWKWNEAVHEGIASLSEQMKKATDERQTLGNALQKVEMRRESLMRNPKILAQKGERVMKMKGARLKVPHQKTTLSLTEELLGARLTWMSFDRRLYISQFGSDEQLSEHISKAALNQWRQQRQNLVIGFSDQVPIWVKKGSERQIFA